MSKVACVRTLLFIVLQWLASAKVVPMKQFHNCNNCYAVTAFEVLRYRKPKLNVTVRELMQSTTQGCSGGDSRKILNHHFRNTKLERGTLYKIISLLKKSRPLIVDLTPQHLVTVWKATEAGILIWDPKNGEERVVSKKDHSMKFKYILYVD